jgi:aryl-alcohol dehydrogenase-like predicted oxidoreductase
VSEGLQRTSTRPLGVTGMKITRVGLGTWAIGGPNWSFGWSSQADDESIAAIRRAVEAGINWVDTAAVYGLGHSEEIVAQALSGFNSTDRPYVFTKCGLVWDKQSPAALPKFIGNAASIRREVEDSLRRLAVERIDLYQMHWPPRDGTPLEEYWGTLLELKREGKIRAAGLSNHSPEQLEIAERIGHVDSLQPPFSAIRRDAGHKELPWCAQRNTGVIVYSPLESGLLSGSFSMERAASLPSDDWRSRSDYFKGDALRRNLALASDLLPVALRHNTTVAAVAIAWTVAWPGVTGAIVGARRPQQVDGWLDAMSLELTLEDLNQIAELIELLGVGSGPARPVYNQL